MSEIVTELRARANALHSGADPSPTAQLCAQAAARIEALEAALAEATDIIRPLAIRYDNTEYKPGHGAVQVPTPWGLYAKASAFIAGRAALEQGS